MRVGKRHPDAQKRSAERINIIFSGLKTLIKPCTLGTYAYKRLNINGLYITASYTLYVGRYIS